MKKAATTALLIFVGVSIAHGNEFRVFTDAQGRAIEARILSFDPVKSEVEIERKDGKRVWVSPTLFSEDDQRYVKGWVSAYRILSDECLQVSFEKKSGENFKKGMTDTENVKTASKGDMMRYEITLRNRSKLPIEGLKIEYRYFVKIKGSGQTRDSMKKIPTMKKTVSRIDPGGRTSFSTDEIAVEIRYDKIRVTDRFTGTFEGYEFRKVSEDELMGVWLKIYGPPLEGEAPVRDVCYPEDLNKEVDWSD